MEEPVVTVEDITTPPQRQRPSGAAEHLPEAEGGVTVVTLEPTDDHIRAATAAAHNEVLGTSVKISDALDEAEKWAKIVVELQALCEATAAQVVDNRSASLTLQQDVDDLQLRRSELRELLQERLATFGDVTSQLEAKAKEASGALKEITRLRVEAEKRNMAATASELGETDHLRSLLAKIEGSTPKRSQAYLYQRPAADKFREMKYT